MSTSGVFTLICNDGKQDALLNATELLRDRLLKIAEEKRSKLPPSEWKSQAALPTLAEIERTHLLFMRSTFKPFVSMASEYQKIKAEGGSNLVVRPHLKYLCLVNLFMTW